MSSMLRISTRFVTGAYLLLALAPFVWIAATDTRLTRTASGDVALVLIALLVLAVVPMRRRWAWWILVIIQGWAATSVLWEYNKPLPYIDNVAQLALLVSPQMRDYVFDRYRTPGGRVLHPPSESTIQWIRKGRNAH